MGTHDNARRGFVWSSRAWYVEAANCKHEISFGMYVKDGGTTGDMRMKWHQVGGTWVPRLECFDDAWDALSTFGDLLQEMAMIDNTNSTEEQFVEILKRCGFEDMTAYQSE